MKRSGAGSVGEGLASHAGLGDRSIDSDSSTGGGGRHDLVEVDANGRSGIPVTGLECEDDLTGRVGGDREGGGEVEEGGRAEGESGLHYDRSKKTNRTDKIYKGDRILFIGEVRSRMLRFIEWKYRKYDLGNKTRQRK